MADQSTIKGSRTTPESSGIRSQRRPSLEMLADRPLAADDADHLGFNAFAIALAELIDNPKTATPLTLAISAPWGAGKTSLGVLLEAQLSERARDRRARPHAVVWFNAWKHDAAEHLGAAFAADVARQLARQRPRSWRLLAPLPSPFLTPAGRWWWRTGAAVALLAAVALIVVFVPAVSDYLLGKAQADRLAALQEKLDPTVAAVTAALIVVVIGYTSLVRLGRAVLAYVGDPRAEAARGSMDQVSGQLGHLIRQATGRWRRRGRRVVIFVDDLERCRPPRAVDVCEVAAQLLAHPNVVTVILADMAVVAASAEIKYAKLERPDEQGKVLRSGYGRLYLQKLVQIEFGLPPARLEEMRALIGGGQEAQTAEEVVQAAEPGEQADGPGWLSPVRQLAVLRMWRQFASRGSSFPAYLRWLRIGGLVVSTASAAGLVVTTELVFILGGNFSDHYTPLALSGSGYFVGALFTAIVPVRLARRAEARLDAVILALSEEGVDDPVVLEERVLASKPAKRWQGLARQRLSRHLVDDSELKHEATAEVLKYLPPLPRSAKRMANHLRIMLVVAYERRMLGGAPSLTAAHLGKWVVLNERWPELARHLKTQPEHLRAWEDTSGAARLRALRDAAGVDLIRDELDQFLAFIDEAPRLGGVLQRLVHLEPAEVVTPGDRAPSTDAERLGPVRPPLGVAGLGPAHGPAPAPADSS